MRRPYSVALVSLAVLAGTVWYLSLMDITLPEPASPTKAKWNEMFTLVFWIAVVVAAVVWGLLLYALFRFRATPGHFKEGPHIHGNTRMEIAWTIAPAVVMGWLLILSYNGLSWVDNHEDYPNDFVIGVEASRFTWEFTYPDNTTSTNKTLFVEVNKNVGLNLQSSDVIHAFSVPELGVMRDAVPGRINQEWFRATIPGNYTIKCRELCGQGHSTMDGTVVVLPEGSTGGRGWGWPGLGAPVAAPQTPTDNGTLPPSQGTVVAVTLAPGGALTIDPKDLAVALGTVTFEVTNDGNARHNLFVGVFDKDKADHGAVGKTETYTTGVRRLVMNFDKDVTYEYWCDEGGHRSGVKGLMSGVIVVGKGGDELPTDDLILPGPNPAWILAGVALAVVVWRRRH